MKEKIVNYFRSRTVAFYIALAMAVLSVVASIVYATTLGDFANYASNLPITLLLVGAGVFAVSAVFGLSNIGSAVMALLNYASMLVFIGTVYSALVEQAMTISGIGDIKGLDVLIANVVLMLLGAIISTVCAWLRHSKKPTKEESEQAEEVSAENE
ncbi:MAG: hypothetical protein ACI4MS_06465 [Candidatus Coproplasma sp.]